MTQRSTGQLMVQSLIDHGVDTVFGIPGVHTYELTDALHQAGNRIRFVQARHEQGAAYMAYGYARSTGRPGVFTVVPGPGVLNAGAALCTALGANAPVMCLTGNIMSHLIGRGRGQLHELPDQLALLSGLTRWAGRINHPTEAPGRMAEAFRHMRAGRPGPVSVEAPWDVFGQRAEVADLPPVALPAPLVPDAGAVTAAADLIRSGRRPLILVGGGAQHASAEVRALAAETGCPVMAHASGKGVMAEDDPLFLDAVAGWEYFQSCDLLIGIGSRLAKPFLYWRWQPPGLKLLRIDIDPLEFVRLPATVGMLADAAAGAAALARELAGYSRPDPRGEIAALRAAAAVRIAGVEPQAGYLRAIRDVLPRDGIFVDEVSQMGFTARFAFPVYEPRSYVSCGYQETLGFGYATALGVKVANPGRAVVSVSGDGGFMFGVQELATAAQHGIGVTAIVFDNGSFGNVRRDQTDRFQGRLIGADLQNPDFPALARSFGIRALEAESPDALRRALGETLAADAPALITVRVPRGSETSPWPLSIPTGRG